MSDAADMHKHAILRLSHTPSISGSSGCLFPDTEVMTSINYIPLPFSFVSLLRKATEAFDDHDGKGPSVHRKDKDQEGVGLGADDWDLL
jgi:hypothetical protein